VEKYEVCVVVAAAAAAAVVVLVVVAAVEVTTVTVFAAGEVPIVKVKGIGDRLEEMPFTPE
jgi:hypothetical protein